eukprot:10539694-Ditylum_brightwellii.AAC.1
MAEYAAYSLIPEKKRGHLHKQVGYLLLDRVPDNQVEEVLFMAVDQLNRGSMFIEETYKRVELAKLNLRAGEKAMSLAAFLSAASYLKVGIETEYCNGHFQEVGHFAGLVIKQAKELQSKIRVHMTLIKALGAQNKLVDAMGIGFTILTQLGVQCPSPLPESHVIFEEFTKTWKFFANRTNAELLSLNMMDDNDILDAMKILHLLSLYAYLSSQEHLYIINITMLKLTIQYGVCNESCAALAVCSFMLVGTENFKESEHIAYLAMTILEKLEAKEFLPQ